MLRFVSFFKHPLSHGLKKRKRFTKSLILVLPEEIMRLVVERVPQIDRIRMASVCKSWRKLLADIPMPPQVPWVLQSDMRFYSMYNDGSVFNIKIPESITASGDDGDCVYCCGCSKGWLVIATQPDCSDSNLFLLAPCSGLTLCLPSLNSLSFFDNYLDELREDFVVSRFIQKVELSHSAKSENEDLLVAALFEAPYNDENLNLLAICKPNSKEWTVVDLLQEHAYSREYGDILFRSGFFNITIISQEVEDEIRIKIPESGQIVSLNCMNTAVKFKLISLTAVTPPFTDFDSRTYLVESIQGELLNVNVVRHLENESEDEDDSEDSDIDDNEDNTSLGMEIFQLQPDDSWVRMDSLGSDQVLFLGTMCSYSSIVSSNSSGIQANCIYFTQYKKGINKLYVFHVENGTIQLLEAPNKKRRINFRTCWFKPNQ